MSVFLCATKIRKLPKIQGFSKIGTIASKGMHANLYITQLEADGMNWWCEQQKYGPQQADPKTLLCGEQRLQRKRQSNRIN